MTSKRPQSEKVTLTLTKEEKRMMEEAVRLHIGDIQSKFPKEANHLFTIRSRLQVMGPTVRLTKKQFGSALFCLEYNSKWVRGMGNPEQLLESLKKIKK